MSWSAAEVLALATKAARGGGAPPAQAARFGQVAALHLMAGRDPALLQAALEALPGGPILDLALAVDRAVSEAARGRPGRLTVVPRNALLDSYIDALPYAARIEQGAAEGLVLQVDVNQPRARAIPRRIEGCATLLARMEALAARTYVPESEASRAKGAGAGLTDND